MRRLVGAVLALAVMACSAAPALAWTYYVRWDGADTHNGKGSTAALAFQTVSAANAVVDAGDTVFVLSLAGGVVKNDTISTSLNKINPARSGNTNPDIGVGKDGQIVYYGSPTDTGRVRLPIPYFELSKNCIKVTGFRLTGLGGNDDAFSFEGTATGQVRVAYAVVESCSIRKQIDWIRSTNCKLAHNVIKWDVHSGANANKAGGAVSFGFFFPQNELFGCYYDTVRANFFDWGTAWTNSRVMVFNDDFSYGLVDSNYSYTIYDNTGYTANYDEMYGLGLGSASYNRFRYNKWVCAAGFQGTLLRHDWQGLVTRCGNLATDCKSDGSNGGGTLPCGYGAHHNSFFADTFMAIGSTTVRYGLTQNGLGRPNDEAHANKWSNCYFKGDRAVTYLFDDSFSDTIQNNTFISRDTAAFGIGEVSAGSPPGVMLNNTLIHHNTMYSQHNWALENHILNATSVGGVVTQNIFYSRKPSTAWGGTYFVSCINPNGITHDKNIYWSTQADSSTTFLVAGPHDGLGSPLSLAGRLGITSPACSYVPPIECSGVFINPKLADTSYVSGDVLHPNIVPDNTSPAFSSQFGPAHPESAVGGQFSIYCGRWAKSNPTSDVIPPAAVPIYVGITMGDVTNKYIQWAEAGNDSFQGQADSVWVVENVNPLGSINNNPASGQYWRNCSIVYSGIPSAPKTLRVLRGVYGTDAEPCTSASYPGPCNGPLYAVVTKDQAGHYSLGPTWGSVYYPNPP